MLQIAFIILYSFFHPFFVTVTEINHNQKNQTLEVSSRIFFDDFETALEKQYNQRVNIVKPVDRKKVDALIADYLKKHLMLAVDGKRVALNYLGYEIEEDAAWCYFEVPDVKSAKKIEVVDRILFEAHPSEINMLHVINNGVRKSTKLDNPEERAEFVF